MNTPLEIKLKDALTLKIKQIKEARINGIHKKDIQILRVDLIQPIIVSPDGILKVDFKNAKEIMFVRGRIKVSEPDNNGRIENMYYFDGNAVIDYQNDEFLIDLKISNIYTN